MSVRVKGMGQARTFLRSVGDRVPDAARGQMKRSAARIVERAKLFVPEDTEALKNSIRIEKSYGERGRLQIDIVAGNATIVQGTRVIDLNQYARIIHERYASMKPGEKTLAKRARNPGVLIGEEFLKRAADEEEKKLNAKLISEITKILKGPTPV